jgi:hypothetical protein
MHLGKVIADYLEKIVETFGLLDPATCEEVKEIEELEASVSPIIDDMVD